MKPILLTTVLALSTAFAHAQSIRVLFTDGVEKKEVFFKVPRTKPFEVKLASGAKCQVDATVFPEVPAVSIAIFDPKTIVAQSSGSFYQKESVAQLMVGDYWCLIQNSNK